MALDTESRLRVLLASAPQTIRPIQTLEITHSAMSQAWLFWREPYAGTVTINSVQRAVQPLNIEIRLAGTENNLDQRFEIRLDTTDIEDEFRREMDAVPLTTAERVVITYREYLSDDLTDVQASARLQLESISYQLGAATLIAVSPRYSLTRTGELYAPREVPMLRGFL